MEYIMSERYNLHLAFVYNKCSKPNLNTSPFGFFLKVQVQQAPHLANILDPAPKKDPQEKIQE